MMQTASIAVVWALLTSVGGAQAFDPLNPGSTFTPPTSAAPTSSVRPDGGRGAVMGGVPAGPGPDAEWALLDSMTDAPSRTLGDAEAARMMLCSTIYLVAAESFKLGLAGNSSDPTDILAIMARGYQPSLDAARALEAAGRQTFVAGGGSAGAYDALQARTNRWGLEGHARGENALGLVLVRSGCPTLAPAVPFQAQLQRVADDVAQAIDASGARGRNP